MRDSLHLLRTRVSAALRFGLLTALASTALGTEVGTGTSPLARVKSVYPHADRCEIRSRLIDTHRRAEVERLLPAGISYRDMGARSVYSALRGSSPLGMLHVRHENGEWGLVEIAWQLNLDHTIYDFTLLQCREFERSMIESEEFRRLLRFKGLDDLSQLLTDDGKFDDTSTTIPRKAQPLAALVVTSALRTLALSIVVDSGENTSLMIRRTAGIRFPELGTLDFSESAEELEFLKSLEPAELLAFTLSPSEGPVFAQGFDRQGRALACFVPVSFALDSGRVPVLFTVVDDRIEGATLLTSETRSSITSGLSKVCGRSLDSLRKSKSAVDQAGALALRLTQHSKRDHVRR